MIQKVVIRGLDGIEVRAYAKFAEDVAGNPVTEYGGQGVCAEFVASQLAALIGAPTPRMVLANLPETVEVTLRDGRHPRPGLAVASREIPDLAEATSPDHLDGVRSLNDLALIRVLHFWIEIQDRGHNIGLASGAVYSLDHATAMRSSWSGSDAAGSDVPDSLMTGRFDERPETLEEAALILKQVTDAQIDGVYAAIPATMMPSDAKRVFEANTKKLRDMTVRRVLQEVDDLRGHTTETA